MKNDIKLIVTFLIISGLIGYYVELYKFSDCKKVGHTTLYCLFNTFK